MKIAPSRLYNFPFSGNGYKIRLALAQLNLPVEIVNLDLLKGETRVPEYYAKNPMGQVPVLELEDGTCLRESNAILHYLTQDTALMPKDLMSQTQVLQWMFFEQSNIAKTLGRARFFKAFPNVRATAPSEWEDWYHTGNKALKVINNHLAEVDFLVGNSYSVADICVYGYVHTADEGGFQLHDYPAVQKWLVNIQHTPGYIPQ